MASSLDQAIDLRYYVRVLWRRKGIILLCAVSVICATAVAVTLMPDVYESSVTVLIEGRSPLASELEHLMGGRSGSPGYRAEERQLAELSARIRSRPFLERVIRRLQMEQDAGIRASATELVQEYPDVSVDEMVMRMLVARLETGIRIGSRNGTYQITVSGYSARNAYALAQAVGLVLIETRRQTALALMKSAQDFGIQHLRYYEERVRAAEDSLEAFKRSLIERGLDVGIVRKDNLALANTLERRIEADLVDARGRVARLANGGSGATLEREARVLRDDSDIQNLDARIRGVLTSGVNEQLSVADATTTTTATWPPAGMYATLRRELLQRLQARATQLGIGAGSSHENSAATYAFYQMDVDAKSKAADFLESSVQQFKQRAQSAPVEEMELSRLENEVAMYRQLLESFRAQKVATDLNQSVALTSLGERVEIVSPAQLPLKPSHPNKLKLLLAAVLMGPCLGVAAAFVSLVLDATSRSLEEFRRVVPEPILGTTPLLSGLVPRHRGIRRYWVPATVTSVILVTAAFFVLRSNIRHEMTTARQPLEIVEPEVSTP